MAKKAALNSIGQLVSSVTDTTNMPPIIVDSDKMVDNLNVEMLGGITEDKMLRTDVDRTLVSGKTLSVKGEIKIEDEGALSVGDFELKSDNGLFYIKTKEG